MHGSPLWAHGAAAKWDFFGGVLREERNSALFKP
jgi:hypothetical protein